MRPSRRHPVSLAPGLPRANPEPPGLTHNSHSLPRQTGHLRLPARRDGYLSSRHIGPKAKIDAPEAPAGSAHAAFSPPEPAIYSTGQTVPTDVTGCHDGR
jgi:hypothetical protein